MKTLKLFLTLVLLTQICVGQTQFKSLNYLYSIRGKNAIGGMHNRQPNANPNSYSQQLNNVTGNWPGLYSADFQFEPNEIANRQTMINQVIAEWNNGAMINIMWHACNPAKGEPCYWDSNGVLSQMSNSEWTQLLTNGTAINNSWKSRMDAIAVYLQQLKNAGVEVFFRPLHEMNQSMFWWGGRPGSNGTAALYRLTHDYLTYNKGLTNLIWVWNMQDFSSMSSDLNNYDPGSSYWDVLTMDMYWSDGQGYTSNKYNAIVNKANGKPIGIGECQDLPAVSLLTSQPLWTFFMGWSELTFQNNSNAKIQEIYWSGKVLTLNEMPGWGNITTPPTGGGGTTAAIPGTFGAESYSSMSGVQTETCTDSGGGLDVGWIDAGDWMTYNVNVASSGTYTVSYRIASPNGGGSIRLEKAGGSPVYGTISVPATGGWQSWQTISHSVQLTAGQQQIALYVPAGGYNINWIDFTSGSGSGSGTGTVQYVQAEAYSNMSGVQKETTSDTGGGQNVGWIDAGDWMSYSNVNIPSSGSYVIGYRVASANGGGSLRLESAGGSVNYGTINISSTGGWQTWTTVYQTVNLTAGTQSFGIKALTAGWNINWWSITKATGSRLIADDLDTDLTTFSAYPNPFHDKINIPVSTTSDFELNIYNVAGSIIRTFGKKDLNEKGNVIWDGTGSQSSVLPIGIYHYKLVTKEGITSGKLLKK